MKPAEKEMRILGVRVEPDEAKFLIDYAENNDFTLSQLLRRAIKDYIEKLKAKKKVRIVSKS